MPTESELKRLGTNDKTFMTTAIAVATLTAKTFTTTTTTFKTSTTTTTVRTVTTAGYLVSPSVCPLSHHRPVCYVINS